MSPVLVEAWPHTVIDMTSSIAHRIANTDGNGARNGPKSSTRKKINVKNKEKGCCVKNGEQAEAKCAENISTRKVFIIGRGVAL